MTALVTNERDPTPASSTWIAAVMTESDSTFARSLILAFGLMAGVIRLAAPFLRKFCPEEGNLD